MILVKVILWFFGTRSLRSVCLDRGGRKTRGFSNASCKIEYVLIVISHFEKFNHWEVTRI